MRIRVVAIACFIALLSSGGSANATPASCDGLPVTLAGSSGDDRIVGTAGRDVIHAGTGNDIIMGLRGNDSLCGGDGADMIDAGPGSDT